MLLRTKAFVQEMIASPISTNKIIGNWQALRFVEAVRADKEQAVAAASNTMRADRPNAADPTPFLAKREER